VLHFLSDIYCCYGYSEQEIIREEIISLRTVKEKLNQKIKDLEEELKKTKEELEKKSTVVKEEDEVNCP